jgi:hypothetical protein
MQDKVLNIFNLFSRIVRNIQRISDIGLMFLLCKKELFNQIDIKTYIYTYFCLITTLSRKVLADSNLKPYNVNKIVV